MKKIIIIFVSFIINVFSITVALAEQVKVGVLLPLTGSQAFYGTAAKNGIDLAREEMAKSDGVDIKLIVEDTQSTPTEAAKGMNKLITSDKVSVVIAEVISSNALVAASIAEKAKIPFLTPASTNDSITVGKKYIFRTCFIDSFQGIAMANFAIEHLKAHTAVVLEDTDSDYSHGISSNFTATFEQAGGKVLKLLKYSQKDISFTTQLAEVRKLNPDILFIPGYHQQVGVILREAKDLQIHSKMLGTDGWFTPDLRNIAQGAEIGGYISTHYATDSNDPRVKAFVAAYTKKYHATPSAHAALGYDSFNIIRQVIQQVGSGDSEKVTEALATLNNFPGVTGNITMDKNHNPVKPAVILEYVPNGYQFLASVQPNLAPPAHSSVAGTQQ